MPLGFTNVGSTLLRPFRFLVYNENERERPMPRPKTRIAAAARDRCRRTESLGAADEAEWTEPVSNGLFSAGGTRPAGRPLPPSPNHLHSKRIWFGVRAGGIGVPTPPRSCAFEERAS